MWWFDEAAAQRRLRPASAAALSPCFLCLFAKERSFGVPNMEKAYFIKWILEGRFDWGGVGRGGLGL